MIKLVKRHTDRACSQKILAKRVAYLVDADHKDHKDKILGTPRNYNCPNGSADAFMGEVARIEAEYQKFRVGKRGKRTRRIFEEIVYSSPYFADLTDQELDVAEQMVVTALVSNSAARSNRHKCKKTGRTDFHILCSAKTNDYPPTTTIWGQFGGPGKACIFAEFDKLDDQIVRRINEGREKDRRIKSRVEVRREKAIAAKGEKPSLAAEIAAATGTTMTADTVQQAIESIGHSVPKITSRYISVVFAGAKRPKRYGLADLLAEIAMAQDSTPTPTAPTAPGFDPRTPAPPPATPPKPPVPGLQPRPTAPPPSTATTPTTPPAPGLQACPTAPMPPPKRRRRIRRRRPPQPPLR